MSEDISIVNEDGTLVGYDGNGEQVPIDLEAISTERGPNETINASPGQFLDKLSTASPGDVVRLDCGETYRIDGEAEIPKDVIVDCNGAVVEPTGDHNVFFLNHGVRLIQPWIDVRSVDFTSNAIEIDTARAGGRYHPIDQTSVAIERAFVLGDQDAMTGTGIHIDADGAPVAGHRNVSATIYGMGDAFTINVTNTHANSNQFSFVIWHCDTGIRRTGGADDPFESTIYGEIQPTKLGARSSHLLVNESGSERTHSFIGRAWDADYPNGAALVGPVNLTLNHNPEGLVDASPDASGIIYSRRRNFISITDLEEQVTYRKRYSAGWERWSRRTEGGSYDRFMDIRTKEDDMVLSLRNTTHLTDLPVYRNATEMEIKHGELAVDEDRDGTGATALVYRDEDGTVHYWDADGTF